MTTIEAESRPADPQESHSMWMILGQIAAAESSRRERERLTESSAAVERYVVPGTDLPIIPDQTEMQGLAAMAVTLSAAGAVPKALRGLPNDVFLVLVTARDLGMALTTGLRELHVIDGKVTLSPKVRLALVRERGRREGWRVWPSGENDEHGASWYATRADTPGETFRSTFTWTDAQNASKLAGKNCEPTAHVNGCPCKDNWKHYPKRMLSWRALGYLLDDCFPEVGVGIYQPDEMGAMTDEEGNAVIDVASTDALPGTDAPRGHGRTRQPDPGDVSAPLDVLQGLEGRIKALPDGAKAALREQWTTAQNEGRVPALTKLLARHVKYAEAMIASIEARATKGEWGEWSPEEVPDQAADGEAQADSVAAVITAPQEPPPTSDGLAPASEAGAPSAAPQPPLAADPQDAPAEHDPELVAVAEEVVAGLSRAEVIAELASKGKSTQGNEKFVRAALRQVLLDEMAAAAATPAE